MEDLAHIGAKLQVGSKLTNWKVLQRPYRLLTEKITLRDAGRLGGLDPNSSPY